jgi:SAM-dependent methyltransferase
MTEPPFLGTTRVAYDCIAADYAERFDDGLADMPLERALFAAFAELVLAEDVGPVADLGCGPGHVTAQLHKLGLTVFGVDLSPEMVSVARRAYPDLRFHEGSMTALDLPDDTLGGVVALYSTMHFPPDQLPGVFAEFHRVLAPGGHLLLSVLIGDELVHRTEAFGREIALDYYLRPPDRLAELLSHAGLVTKARLLREPAETEKLPRAYLLARKPTGPGGARPESGGG